MAGLARPQIREQLVFAPGDRRLRQRGQRRCLPALGEAAGEIGAGFLGAERVARRVTCGAVAEALDEISAAIPDRRFRRIRLDER
jgi:hypothetical protein